MKENYESQLNGFFARLGDAKKMVLATSKDNKVTARMMSCVIISGVIYLQTDKRFIKYEQISANPLVALCVDNIQIEGVAEVGSFPLHDDNSAFITAFQQYYKGSFAMYSHLKNERVIRIRPTKITIWEYENGQPFRAFFDILEKTYSKELYVGE